MVTVHKQEFFKAEEISWNKGTSISISFLPNERKIAQVKIFSISLTCSCFWKNFSLNVLLKNLNPLVTGVH